MPWVLLSMQFYWSFFFYTFIGLIFGRIIFLQHLKNRKFGCMFFHVCKSIFVNTFVNVAFSSMLNFITNRMRITYILRRTYFFHLYFTYFYKMLHDSFCQITYTTYCAIYSYNTNKGKVNSLSTYYKNKAGIG